MKDSLPARLATDLDGAFPDLVSTEIDIVYTALYRAGGRGVDAEDVAQETFLRAYSALNGYGSRRIKDLKLRPWVLTIAMNLWRNELRRRARHPVILGNEDQLSIDSALGPEEEALRKETWAGLEDLVGSMPERYRIPIVLRFVVGLSLTEVAEVLGRPAGTVKAQVSRGLAMLRKHLETEDKEEAR